MRSAPVFLLIVVLGGMTSARAGADYPRQAAGLSDVRVTSGFWYDRFETNRLVTLKTCFDKCNETPRIANFTNAARRAWGTFGGVCWDDSDVYKVMEGAAYVLAQHPDPKLEAYMIWLIGQIAKAQEPDGYLYTARTLGQRNACVDARWEILEGSHELYNQGHMIEAAVAWHQATGRDDFLKVAIRSADLMCRTFGIEPTQLKLTAGHQEIELALCKLFRETGTRKYLDLAKFFLDVRANREMGGPTWGVAVQAHRPVLEQDEALGHAVRAGYMYSGMADVACLTGDRRYIAAIDRLWQNVVAKKLYLTGGIGGFKSYTHPLWGEAGECFGADYDLPNEDAYLETCAAIANALWNQRMFLIHGEAKYVDVLERVLYNGFVSGISLSGDTFFYPNPLSTKGGYKRKGWFGCSCCPVNDVRFVPQVPSMAFATDRKGTVYWNLFMAGEAKIAGAKLKVETDYPWNGKVKLTVTEVGSDAARTPRLRVLKVRIPGWALGQPVPSDLYRASLGRGEASASTSVNGLALADRPGADGYIAIVRDWKAGDAVELDLPMPVARIRAHAKVAADADAVAIQRGPIVYCAEGCDNGGKAFGATLPADATLADDTISIGGKTYPAHKASNGVKLIPYALWGNREPGNDMTVWLKEKRE